MPSIISHENGDGSFHTIASIEAVDAPGVVERSDAYSPVELIVHDLSNPKGFTEAVDDAAVASAVIMSQTGQRIGRELSIFTLAKWREDSKPRYKAIMEQARDLGQVVVTLTAPTQDAVEAILASHEQ